MINQGCAWSFYMMSVKKNMKKKYYFDAQSTTILAGMKSIESGYRQEWADGYEALEIKEKILFQ